MSYIGPQCFQNEICFKVWAPQKETMQLHIVSPQPQILDMEKVQDGYFTLHLKNPSPDLKYYYAPDQGRPYPDPGSNFQPDGVHGPSQVIDHSLFQWEDAKWTNIPLKEMIFYEVHVGTFTAEGTFEAIIPRLDELAETGINVIELMPVSQFPGDRNWGYDGVFPCAVQNSYGGPDQLKMLVNEAHKRGIAVFLDVVFNHLGPEGNYFGQFGPYFTDKYCTPWGKAINFDDAFCDPVREFFSDVVLYWYEHFHLDGLRLDAVHTMYDSGAITFWELLEAKLTDARQKIGRPFYLVAESDLNSPRVVGPARDGGFGMDAQWLDDFHHALYVLLDQDGKSRYEDFGQMQQLAKAYTDGFVHGGEYVKFRKRKHGASSAGLPGNTFVVFNQNHDQIGNRVKGERLSMLVDFEKQKLAAAAILLSPYIPMFFMGEEYGEDSPFFYFVSHSEQQLIEMVVEGRKKEFAAFDWDTEPMNPQQQDTFEKSKIDWKKRSVGKYKIMLAWHKALIVLRKTFGPFQNFNKNDIHVNVFGQGFTMHRRSTDQKQESLCIFNFSEQQTEFYTPEIRTQWEKVLDSSDPFWMQNPDEKQKPAPDLLVPGQHISLTGPCVMVYTMLP